MSPVKSGQVQVHPAQKRYRGRACYAMPAPCAVLHAVLHAPRRLADRRAAGGWL